MGKFRSQLILVKPVERNLLPLFPWTLLVSISIATTATMNMRSGKQTLRTEIDIASHGYRAQEGTDANVRVVDGYTDKISYAPGDKARVYINAEEEVEGGNLYLHSASGTEVDTVVTDAKPQIPSQSEPWKNGFGYDVTFEYDIPDLKSGYYRWDDKIPFIVRSNHEKVDAIVVYPSNTINAYTTSGGKSLYRPLNEPAQRVSFLRPENHGDWLHISLYEWLERQNQFDVGYVCDSDLDDFREIERSRLLVITGHSEYWTRKARENFDRFVDLGNHALVLSGNTMWWQVRYDEDKTQLICHKYWFEPDPTEDPLLRTVRWNDPSLQYPIIVSIGADFDRGGYGKLLDAGGWYGYKVTSPESPLLEGTGLLEGQILTLHTDEYDGAPRTGFDNSGYPLLDTTLLNFYKLELIGFDLCAVLTDSDRVATFIAFQKSETSGIVINGASTDWCGVHGIGKSKNIEKVTLNMFDKLLSDSEVFSPSVALIAGYQDVLDLVPTSFVLHPNYPNPFNPTTTLRYDLPERSEVTLMIYDILGREVRALVRGMEQPGRKSVTWDGTNDLGQKVSAGVYLYRIQAGDFTQTRKMVLLR